MIDPDPTKPAEGGPLPGRVGRRGPTGAGEPAGEGSVEAPGDGILHGHAVDGEERSGLEGIGGARRMRSDHADVEVDHSRAQREHGVGALQQHAQPAGPVVHPLAVNDVARVNVEGARDVHDQLRFNRSRAQERWSRERQAVVCAVDLDEAGNALLHDHVVVLWSTTGLQSQHPGSALYVATGDLNMQNKLSAVGLPFVELP